DGTRTYNLLPADSVSSALTRVVATAAMRAGAGSSCAAAIWAAAAASCGMISAGPRTPWTWPSDLTRWTAPDRPSRYRPASGTATDGRPAPPGTALLGTARRGYCPPGGAPEAW